jgi:CRP-like cAMP-binding protein
MEREHYKFISSLFPFKNIKEKQLESIFSSVNYEVADYARGDIIFSPSVYRRKVGFIISGECEIERERTDDGKVTLNTLTRFASFGIMTVLSGKEEYPTVIRATKNSRILFIDGDDLLTIIRKYPTVAMNVIRFLSGRIEFLNERIATFSEKSTISKLANYLLSKCDADGATIKESKTRLASAIGVGRASLYRDLDSLTSSGLISYDTKQIIIIDRKGLERIRK